MKGLCRALVGIAIALLLSQPAFAGAGTITTKDASGATKTFVIVTDGSGNFIASTVLCDQSAGATCASVGTAGSPSTNALTVQAVTLGHGTAANAARVELPTDGTGVIAGVTTVSTVTSVTNIAGQTGWAGGTLGAMANYGTSPGAVLVPGANVFVTNTLTGVGNTADGISGIAAPNAGSPVISYNYGFNGATWDRLQVDGSRQLKTVVATTTNAGAATVKGGVGVVNGGSFYQAVAASQTATVLQSSTGAIGDYLSHCVIFPATTSPGAVTVFDNTNTAANSTVLFAGGASSVSNLAPISVPVGAVSVNGAWKATTLTNVSIVCYGKFS